MLEENKKGARPLMNQSTRLNFWVTIVIIVACVLMRFIPHLANYSPVLGMLLFSGYVFADKKYALILPLFALFLSDLVFGLYDGISLVYLGYLFIVALGLFIKSRKPIVLAMNALAASAVFFISSNLGVWLFTSLYPKTWPGLVDCFVMALPFFRGTLVSTFISTAVLFGAYSLIRGVRHESRNSRIYTKTS